MRTNEREVVLQFHKQFHKQADSGGSVINLAFRMLKECKCLKMSEKFLIMSLNMDHKPPNANRWSVFMRGRCN